jgi:hypothetical protein
MSKSKLAPVLALGVLLAAMILASATAADAKDGSNGSAFTQDGRRPPTERQVGEAWRHRPAADQQTVTSTSQMRRPPTEGKVGEAWHPRVSVPAGPAEPRGRPSWPVALLAASAAIVLLLASLAVLGAKRAGRKPRVGQVA